MNKISEKGLFILFLVLNSICLSLNIFVFKDWFNYWISGIAIVFCIVTLIRIKKRGK